MSVVVPIKGYGAPAPVPPAPDPGLRLSDEQMQRMRLHREAGLDQLPARTSAAARGFIPNQRVRMSDVSASLQLAAKSDFLKMCQPLLWGNEKQERLQEFGELLRGAVETFVPETTFDLHLLKTIVAALWRLNRLLEIQSNVFEAGAQEEEEKAGMHGLPAATVNALTFDERVDQAQKNLEIAISTYRKLKR
jgi:hypothetical protein